jgi:hypothetical protein
VESPRREYAFAVVEPVRFVSRHFWQTSARRKTNDAEGVAMTASETISDRRRALREHPEFKLVQRDEFCQLLLSFRRLIRSDEPALRMRGLLDVESGERYLIEQEELFTGCV